MSRIFMSKFSVNHLLLNSLNKFKMAVKNKSDKRIKKEDYWVRLQKAAQKYKNVMFVDANNVSSKQIGNIRRGLRDIDAYMIMGKNVSNYCVFSANAKNGAY
jgi:hypothetical protein